MNDLVLTGALARHPRIRFVVADAGAVLPLLASRLELLADDGALLAEQLAHLWFDLGTSGLWPGESDQVLYGSGYCFTPPDRVERQLARLDGSGSASGSGSSWREVTAANSTRLLGDAERTQRHPPAGVESGEEVQVPMLRPVRRSAPPIASTFAPPSRTVSPRGLDHEICSRTFMARHEGPSCSPAIRRTRAEFTV